MPKQTLKQRADGRYRVKYAGKYFYGSTQREAMAARDEYKRAMEAGEAAEAQGITLHAYAMRWVSTYKAHLSDAAYNTHVRIINRLCDHEGLGARRVRSIVASDVQSFYNTYAGMSQSTLNSVRDTVRGIFKAAVADNILRTDPTQRATPPKGTKGSHRAITAHERDLIHRTQHRMRAAVMVMLYAGLRRGEVCALDIDTDVDFDARTITVNRAVFFDGQNHPVLKDPKTEAGVRTIPMPDILANDLRGLHGLVLTGADGGLISESGWTRCWNSYMTAINIEENGIRKRWHGNTKEHKALLAAGLPLPEYNEISIRSHDLRHSYCTMLYEAGVDLKSCMTWMGHADEEMTMQIYTHLSDERLRISADALHRYVKNTY